MISADETEAVTAVTNHPHHDERHPAVIVSAVDDYYLLHQPLSQQYLPLSPAEYALWWRLDGHTSPVELLRYANGRFATFNPDQLQTLLRNLRYGQFVLQAGETAVVSPPPAPPNTLIGLHDLLRPLAQRLAPLFSRWGQLALLFVVYIGSGLLLHLLRQRQLPLAIPGFWSLLTLPLATLLLHLLRQLGRGVWLTHHGVTVATATWHWRTGLELDSRHSQQLPQKLRRQFPLIGSLTTLLAGSVGGLLLTAVSRYAPQLLASQNLFSRLVFGTLPQLTLLAYLVTLASLNPLSSSDGYGWLAQRWQLPAAPRAFWQAPKPLWRHKRPFYLLLSGLYVLLWLSVIGYLTSSLPPLRPPLLRPFLAAASLLLLPLLRWLAYASQPWRQRQREWVRQRPFLTHPNILFIILAPPLLLGMPLLLVTLATRLSQPTLPTLLIWGLHLATIAIWWRLTQGHPATLPLTNFLWSCTFTAGCLALAWLTEPMGWLRAGALLLAGLMLLLAGGKTAVSHPRQQSDWLWPGLALLLGIGSGWGLERATGGLTAVVTLLLIATTLGIAGLMLPLRNLHRTRFVGAWYTLLPALFALPWLLIYPQLHLFVLVIWLFAGLFYLVLHTVIPKNRPNSTVLVQLSTVFQHFLQHLLAQAELLLGQRPLLPLYSQLAALKFPTGAAATPTAVQQAHQQAFLLAADRLTRLGNIELTTQLVQQTVQSLPWQPRYQISQRLLAPAAWDAPFVAWQRQAYWEREQLLQQTAVFPTNLLPDLLRLGQERFVAAGEVVAYAGTPCQSWSLLLAGQAREDDRQRTTDNGRPSSVVRRLVSPGSWLGGEGFLGLGNYWQTVAAVSDSYWLDLPYADLLPLLFTHRQAKRQLAQAQQLHPWLQPHFSLRDQILVAARMQPQTLPAATPLPPTGLYLLQSGGLTTPAGKQLAGGALVGIDWLWREPASPTIQTTMPSHLWLLPRAEFSKLLR